MKYEDLRPLAKDGDLMFLHGNPKAITTILIKWATKSDLTHVAFVFWYKDRLMLIESTISGGIRIVSASTYSDHDVELVSSGKSWDEIEWKALERSGTARYGWFSAFYIGLREFLFTRFGVKLPVNAGNRNKACSEYTSEVLELDDVDISPGVLYKLLKTPK